MKTLPAFKTALSLIVALTSIAGAADVLDIGPGAKSIALGRTFTSVRADGYGIFGNPASPAGLSSCEIVSMYGQMDDFSSYAMLGFARPSKYGTFFAGYANNQIKDITATVLDPVTGRPAAAGSFSFRNDRLLLGYAQSINPMISYGFRVKYSGMTSPDMGQVSAWGINGDAGIQAKASDTLCLGLSVNNALPGGPGALRLRNGETEEQPLAVAVGAGYFPNKQWSFYSDLSGTKKTPVLAKLGAEWKPKDLFALRCGAEQMSAGWGSNYVNATVGAGFTLGQFTLDYAYYFDSMVATNSRHFISLAVKLPCGCGQKKEKETAAVPPVVQEAARPAAPVAPVVEKEAVPFELTLTAKSTSTLLWSWPEVEGASSYELFSVSEAGPKHLATVAAPSTSWLETALEENTVYTRSVNAALADGKTVSSPVVSRQTFAVKTVKAAEDIQMEASSINFDNNGSAVRDADKPALERITRFLLTARLSRVRIEGHTDNVGDEEYNKKLSQDRAENLKQYLIGKGVRPDILEPVGFGSSRPVADNATEEGRLANRRVEFVIITPDGSELRSARHD